MSQIKSIDPSTISQPSLHAYLLAAVAPRPIAFASTVDEAGRVNLSPFSFFNVFSSNPPIMIFSPARSGRNGSTKDTLDNVRAVPEVVINIVNHPIVEQMSLSSTAYAKGVNEFVKAGLSQVASEQVRPPRVGEAPVAFECVVEQVIALGDGGGAGNLVIAKVVMIHVQEKYLNEQGFLDTKKLDLVGRMGESWYCRASGEALFEIPKPIRNKGIGVDALPEHVRNSSILTGNNLGRLGNVAQLPSASLMANLTKEAEVQAVLKLMVNGEEADYRTRQHRLAQTYLEKGETEKALGVLML